MLEVIRQEIQALKGDIANRGNKSDRPSLDLKSWCEHYLPEHFYRGWSQFHLDLFGRLEHIGTTRDQKERIIAPRGAGKSHVTAFAYPLRQLLEGEERYILIASDTYSQACERVRDIKLELSMNERLRDAYGNLCEPGPVWRQDFLEFNNGCVVKAVGQGGAVRGIKHGKNRPSLILIDDPEGERHITSATERDKSWRWLTKAILKCGQPGTNFFIIGTALHPDCMVMRTEHTGGWQCQTFQAVPSMPSRMDLWHEWKDIYNNFGMTKTEREAEAYAFYESNKEEMDKGATVFWDNYSLYDLMKTWAEDIGAFNTELQGIPYDPAMAYFSPMYLEGDDLWFDEFPRDLVLKLVSLDPSLGETMKSDYQAVVQWGIDRNGCEYVDCHMVRQDTPNLCKTVVDICRWHKPQELVVEAVAFQRMLGPDLEAEANEQGIPQLDIYLMAGGYTTWKKEIKIEALSSPLHRRKIRFRRKSPGVAILMQQLREYPFGAHDDGPDALAFARFRASQFDLEMVKG